MAHRDPPDPDRRPRFFRPIEYPSTDEVLRVTNSPTISYDATQTMSLAMSM